MNALAHWIMSQVNQRQSLLTAETKAVIEACGRSWHPQRRPPGMDDAAWTRRQKFEAQTETLANLGAERLKALWDEVAAGFERGDDGASPEGFDYEAIHCALNWIGEGDYCAC